MSTDRDRLREIEGHEAWLSRYASPLPSREAISRVKEAVRLELDAVELLGDATGPPPSLELMERVKRRVRGELAVRRRGSVWGRWRSAGLSAAACLALLSGLAWQALAPGRDGTLAAAERELTEFVETLDGILEEGNVQLALLEKDVSDLEVGALDNVRWESDWGDADLDEVVHRSGVDDGVIQHLVASKLFRDGCRVPAHALDVAARALVPVFRGTSQQKDTLERCGPKLPEERRLTRST